MEFDSINKFIEQDFGLPSLTYRDRSAPSMLTSFDFQETPNSPLVLTPRQCPKSDYATSSPLSGTVVRVHTADRLHTVIIRIAGNTLASVLFGPSYQLRDASHDLLGFGQLSTGDQVITSATPDPQRALVYTAFALTDRSVRRLTNARAVVSSVVSDGSSFTAQFGSTTYVVNLGRGSKLVLPDGSRTAPQDLQSSQIVTVSGLVDEQTKTVILASTVRILNVPGLHLTVSAAHSKVKPGQTETIAIGGAPKSKVTLEIRYPSGAKTTAHLTVGSNGKASYSFRVPLGANSISSQKAAVTVASGSTHATTSFLMERATVEIYLSHGSIKHGAVQTIRILGPRRAFTRVNVLWPDGHYTTGSLHLDSKGHATYNFRVPNMPSRLHSHTATVEVLVTQPWAVYAAPARFTVT
jgi:hypothetical protein